MNARDAIVASITAQCEVQAATSVRTRENATQGCCIVLQ